MRRLHLTTRRQLAEPRLPRQPPRSPAELLGPNHPFARGDRLQRDLRRQSVVTAAALAVGASAYAGGRGWGLPLLIAAGIVELGLGLALVLQGGLQRERVRELIIAGRDDLPLPRLQRERRRLLRPRQTRSLARALDELVRAAERWPRLVPSSRPVFDPRLVRAAGPQLHRIATRLREPSVSVRAVARVEQLLTSGASPLYGRELEELRSELRLIEADLDSNDSLDDPEHGRYPA